MVRESVRKFLTNNHRYQKENPAYRMVYLLNVLLLMMFFGCALYTVLNLLIPCDLRGIYINAAATLCALTLLIYFHKTDQFDVTKHLAVGVFLIVLIFFLEITQNSNYGLYWIVTVPPVIYFLLGTKKTRIVISLFGAYLLYFILSHRSGWPPAEFSPAAIINVVGATLALTLMIGYFERSRKEALDGLLATNAVLEDNENELRLILDTAAEGVYGVDTDGNCTFCNNSCLELLGYSSETELIGKNMHVLLHNRLGDGTELLSKNCRIQKTITMGEKVRIEDEVFWRADGTCFDTEYFANPKYKDNKIVGAVVTFMDISERKCNEKQIQYLSSHDSLTGLLNRQCFETEIKKHNQNDYFPLSIIYGDLDGLKLINDIFGHTAGDELIRKASNVLKIACRESDLLARIGGDEFVWILPNTDAETAETIVEHVKKELQKEDAASIKCRMSLGAYTQYLPDGDMEQALKSAENEMYRRKTLQRKHSEIVMLQELITALHERCRYAKSHSENTSQLCEKMGIALTWTEADIKNITDAGYYHDIGKVVFSEALLNKVDHLTPTEKFEKQQHPVVGYRIMNLFDHTLDLAEAVYYHHERWDGSGYPKGLKREEIPIQSRIIAIAEQYDHLRNRNMDQPMSKEAAFQKMRELSGVKYDPDLTELFIQIVGEWEDSD